MQDEEKCSCWSQREYDTGRKYRPSRGCLALDDWRRNPFIWLHYVQSNDGTQLADFVLRANDTSHWSIHDVQRYYRGQLHCEKVLFTCQYPNLRLPTPLGTHKWRYYAAGKRLPITYLKEFHRSLEIGLKKMEKERAQMDRLIVYDQLIKIDVMDYFRRKKFFESLLNILSFQDGLQLISFENLHASRLEGVRLLQQLACFNSHSLKYLFLWYFVRKDENPLLVNYSYITGSGQYIPRPLSAQCFLRSLGELRNLRVLALEYGHVADGTGSAICLLLPVIKRPHFRFQLLCGEGHVPGRADSSLGGGGHGIPDYAWRRVAIACPDLFLAMIFLEKIVKELSAAIRCCIEGFLHKVLHSDNGRYVYLRDYDHTQRILTPSVPLREAHLHQGLRLDCEDFDVQSFVRHLTGHYASMLVTLSIHLRRNITFPLCHTLQRLPSIVRFHCVCAVDEKDLREMLDLIACGVCCNLKEVMFLVEIDEAKRDDCAAFLSHLYEEYKDIMQLFEINFCLKLY